MDIPEISWIKESEKEYKLRTLGLNEVPSKEELEN
jgi:hypothetical protein